MAITAHWIEATRVETIASTQPQYLLKLCSELIEFHRVPGHHDGAHLAEAFLLVIDRLQIDKKANCHVLVVYHAQFISSYF